MCNNDQFGLEKSASELNTASVLMWTCIKNMTDVIQFHPKLQIREPRLETVLDTANTRQAEGCLLC